MTQVERSGSDSDLSTHSRDPHPPLLSSLYSASSFPRAVHPPETEHKRYPHNHPIFWSQHASISTVCHLLSSLGKVVTEVVGRLISHTNGCSSAAHPSHIAFERPLSGQLDVPHYPSQLREGQRQDCLLRRVQHYADTGWKHLPAVSAHPQVQVAFTNISAPKGTDFHRHESYLTQENAECPSAHSPCQVQYHVHVCSSMRVVKLVGLVLSLFHSRLFGFFLTNQLGRYSILVFRRQSFITSTKPLSMAPHCLGTVNCTSTNHIHLQSRFNSCRFGVDRGDGEYFF